DTFQHRISGASNRQLSRRMVWRFNVRSDRFLHYGMDFLRGAERRRGAAVRTDRRARRDGAAARGDQGMIRQTHRPLLWIVLAALLAYVTYLSFKAYLGPDFLIGYANMFSC